MAAISLRQRWSWILGAAMLTILVGGASLWIAGDRTTPLENDCASVIGLGRRSNDLATWMRAGLDDGTLRDPSEIVERESALSDSLRAAADSVRTAEMTQPLTEWADAVALYAQLQREANTMSPDVYPPPAEWTNNLRKQNQMTDHAVDALDRQCPGLKEIVNGS